MRITSLLGHAVIVVDDRGGHRLYVVIGARCDAPIALAWRDDDGAAPRRPLTCPTRPTPDAPGPARGGC